MLDGDKSYEEVQGGKDRECCWGVREVQFNKLVIKH